MEEREILVGRVYKHFKGHHVKVLGIAIHSETTERLVIYKHLNSGVVWARPYDMFAGRVDRNMYPICEQEYRFELVESTS